MFILDNNELIKAIGEMIDQKFDQKFDQKLAPIIADIAAIKADVSGLKADVSGLKTDVSSLKSEVAANTKNITLIATRMGKLEKRTQRLEVLLEHEIPHSIRLLAEGHGAILDKIVDKRDIDDIKDRVSTTEVVLSIHTKEINLLKVAR